LKFDEILGDTPLRMSLKFHGIDTFYKGGPLAKYEEIRRNSMKS